MRRVDTSGHLFVLDSAKHRSTNRSHHSFTSVPYVGGKKVPNARQAFLYVSTDSISGGECRVFIDKLDEDEGALLLKLLSRIG